MYISILEVVVYLLNRFPPKYGLYDTLIPSKIVEGKPKVDTGQKKITLGNILCLKLLKRIKREADVSRQLH